MSQPTREAAAGLKEWAVVCRALLEGEQVIILRKGGIREDGRRFSVPHERFWLFPTYEHQSEQSDLVTPAYRWARDAEMESAPPAGSIRLPGWAEVVGIRRTDDPEVVQALASHTILSADYAEQRLRWKRREALWVLALRAHRLARPLTVPAHESYGGCSSWVTLLGEVPVPSGGTAALSDPAFAARVERVLAVVPELPAA